jgi:hypothetical protein
MGGVDGVVCGGEGGGEVVVGEGRVPHAVDQDDGGFGGSHCGLFKWKGSS